VSQAELEDTGDTAKGSSPFDRSRARHNLGPSTKLILVLDRRPMVAYREHAMLAIEPSSPWHELLPQEQILRVLTREQHDAEVAHEYELLERALKNAERWRSA
jgi:hypothetical protein